MDVRPNLRLCGPLLKVLLGRDGVADTTSSYNIGEGHLTVHAHRLTASSACILRKERTGMLVYVQDKDGQPLMPTCRYGKVRRMLNNREAIVVKRRPFVIRLCYDTECHTQPVDLGIDTGSKVIGVSACTEVREVYAAEVSLRTDIVRNLAKRRQYRRARRYRKTRYRKARFENRVHGKHKGWLAPSIEAKINTHLKVIKDVSSILPVSHITVETAAFDVQMIKALQQGKPLPEGTDYQHGEQMGFWNVREYVLFRDGHVCQCCKGKSRDPILNVHHIESRKTGGDAPGNLVTLCETCHNLYHQKRVRLPEKVKRSPSLRDAVFMGVMRWAIYKRLREMYPGMISMTYGYITKNTRIRHGLKKTHAVDARCISGHPNVLPLGEYYAQIKVRCHNRQLHKANILKGSIRKSNQAAKAVKGFRLFDAVTYNGEECFVFGRRTQGYFDLRHLDGTKVSASASWKKIRLLEHPGTILTESRPA